MRKNGRHCPLEIFYFIFLYQMYWLICIQTPKTNQLPRVVLTTSHHWFTYWSGEIQPTSQNFYQGRSRLLTQTCVTRPRWVKPIHRAAANRQFLIIYPSSFIKASAVASPGYPGNTKLKPWLMVSWLLLASHHIFVIRWCDSQQPATFQCGKYSLHATA